MPTCVSRSAYNAMNNSKITKVAIYTRVSTDHQIDKDSLPMQRKDLVAYCELVIGTKSYEVFEDAGYSGKNTIRPGFQEMMSRIRSGEFSHVLVWKIDRISRNLLDFAQMYAELKKLGVAFISKNEQFDTSSAMGEAMLKIILVFAELERNMTSERVTATMISRASVGSWNGGHVPFGYSYNQETGEFSICESEAEIVRYMHDKYEELRSLIWLCNDLNNHGYRTRRGNMWTPTGVSYVLGSNFYTGDYQYNIHADGRHSHVKDKSEWTSFENHHPAIISREQKDRVNALLTFNDRGKKSVRLRPRKTHNIHIFGSIMRCGQCGKAMYPSPRSAYSDGTLSSIYMCQTRRKSSALCSQKSFSDVYIGDFVFNFLANMIAARKGFTDGQSVDDVQRILLKGPAFSSVEKLDDAGLSALFDMISARMPSELYASTAQTKAPEDGKIASLRVQRQKQERALKRLTDLYLFSESNMSEREFIVRKSEIESSIASIDDQIEKGTERDASQTDFEFIKAASEFIVTQELEKDGEISFRQLLNTMDHKVLHDFMASTIKSIVVSGDHVDEIIFRNGLSVSFKYKAKEPAE